METKRAFTAIMLSLAILLGYQYFFAPAPQEIATPEPQGQTVPSDAAPSGPSVSPAYDSAISALSPDELVPATESSAPSTAKEITIETSQYTAHITENGGGIKSFNLKKYNESTKPDSPLKQLIFTEQANELPLLFAWGNGIPARTPLYKASQESIQTAPGQQAILSMSATLLPGLTVDRTLVFSDDSYTIGVEYTVNNNTEQALQGAPFIRTTNLPFIQNDGKNSQYLFSGPAVFLDDTLEEIKPTKLGRV
jgi:YidC/Oxa1 family membrane protein insertase